MAGYKLGAEQLVFNALITVVSVCLCVLPLP